MGSDWEHQVKRYIGADCADFVAIVLQKCGSSIPDDPYAHQLYENAKDGKHGLWLVMETTIKGNNVRPEPLPGDILLFDGIGVNIPDGKYDHATFFLKGNGNMFLDRFDNSLQASSSLGKIFIKNYTGLVKDKTKVAIIRFLK